MLRRLLLIIGIPLVSFLFIRQCQGQSIKPTLSNGVITYLREDGQQATMQVRRECADLWVSPDESVIAFITLDKIEPPTREYGYLEESSIYIARRSDHFKPIQVHLRPIHISQRKVVRQPSLSPDLKTLYFLVPSYMTSWTLISTQLSSSPNTKITDLIGDGYCVIWGGRFSGDLLLNLRQQGKNGIDYPCFHRAKDGQLTKIGTGNECFEFTNFALEWSQKHGGICLEPEFTQIW